MTDDLNSGRQNGFTGAENEPFDFREYLLNLLSYWKWFVASIVVFSSLAHVFSLTSTPLYPVKGTLFVQQDKKNSDRSAMKELDYFEVSTNIENEIEILGSFSLLLQVVDSLDANIEYYGESDVTPLEQKRVDNNIHLSIHSISHGLNYFDVSLKIVNSTDFELFFASAEHNESQSIFGKFGEKMDLGIVTFTIEKRGSFDSKDQGKELALKVYDPEYYTQMLRRQFKISPISPKSSIIQLTFETANPKRGEAMVNLLMNIYVQRELALKNEKADKTIQFIDNQLVSVLDRLTFTEGQLEIFRADKGILNFSQEGTEVYNRLTDLENELSGINIQLGYYNYLIDYLDNPLPGNIVSPSTAGITDQVLNGLVLKLNDLSSQIVKLGASVSRINPQILTLKEQLAANIMAIKENVQNLAKVSRLQKMSLEERIALAEKEMRQLPYDERKLLNLERTFNLNEGLYTYLLEQKAQAEIARASNEATSKVIDNATIGPQSYPKKSINIIFGILIGLILPVVALSLKDYFSKTVYRLDEVKERLNIPYLGGIATTKERVSLITHVSPNSSIANGFHQIRVRVVALLKTGLPGKAILVSSYANGEGKTFVATNMAIAMAQAGFKTLLVDLNLREPDVFKTLNVDDNPGIAAMIENGISAEKAILKTGWSDLDFLAAGEVQVENIYRLLAGEELKNSLDLLKATYDFIVIDSPAMNSVPDALEVSKLADLFIYIVRIGRSSYDSVEYLNYLISYGIIENAAIVANELD